MALTVASTTSRIVVTGTVAIAQVVWSKKVYIQWIYWYNPTAAADLVSIVDSDSKPIFLFKAQAATEPVFVPYNPNCLGDPDKNIYIDDMDSGTIIIKIRRV